GHAMRSAINPQTIRLCQCGDVAAIGLDATRPLTVHRRVVRIGHDHRVPQALEMLRDPLAAGATLEQDPQRRPPAENLREARTRGRNASLQHDRTLAVDDPDLAFLRMQIDGTILHGWLLLVRLERVYPCGAHATTQGSASRFISSPWSSFCEGPSKQ